MYFIDGDSYNVYEKNGKWYAEVFAGNNIARTIEAKSEKQAHFLVARDYGPLPTAQALARKADKDYNSNAGKAWRAKQAKKGE